MHPEDFCKHFIKTSLSLMFLSNSALALLLGIPYNVQRHKKVLGLEQAVFCQGEVVQMVTSSVIAVLAFYLLLYRVVTCCRFRVPKSVTLITIAALSMLGACYLTIYGGRGSCCEFDGSQNQTCYRRPDIDLPLAWFSVATSLTSVVLSFVLHLHETAMHAWLQLENDDNHGPPRFSHPTLRDSLELAKMRKSSDGNYPNPEEFPVCCPPPPYESSPTILSSYVLPSIPLRRRDMNKLGLTVITDIPAGLPFESPRKRWRGRGRDVWERKPLGASMKLERK